MITTANRLNGIGEYYFSQKLREIDELNKQGRQVINLGIGSPDLPPHPQVIKVLQEESAKPTVHAYQSYKGSPMLRQAIAEWYRQWYDVDLDPEKEILPLIGSKEGIMHICMTYLNEGDIVLIPNPGYPTYRSASAIAGAKIIEYNLTEENNWFPDFDEIEKKLENNEQVSSHHSKNRQRALMWVNYPHMPTGQLPTKKLFEQLVAFGKKNNILICHDNPYSFILNDSPMSLLSIENSKDCVIELNSLSKSHNMAGWRVGMLCGAAERINEVLRFKSNMDSGMFLPVQLAAAKALGLKKDWYDEVNNVYKKRREKVFDLLTILNCSFSRLQAGLFVWAQIPARYKNAFELSNSVLYNHNVFITPGGIFGSAGEKFVRASLCVGEEKIDEAIQRIKITVMTKENFLTNGSDQAGAMERKKITVVGVGLIGGSLALQLHNKKISSKLFGVESSTEHANKALKMELVDEILSLEEAIHESDIIFLAIPVDQIVETLPLILNKIENQIVIDLGSAKAQIIEKIKDHPKRGRFVAAHPMWGTEYSGPGAAVKDAFENKAVIICNSNDSDKDAIDWTKKMFRKIGMHLIEMDAQAHDLHAAYVSHISHITSFALANTVLEKEKEEDAIFELASAGFESTVRLAKSNPAMWVPIFIQNRENVLDVLNEHIFQLKKFKTCLEQEDYEQLHELIKHANTIRKIIH